MSYNRPASNVAVAEGQTSGTAGIQGHGVGVARVLPISSLRFVLALCVVIGHFGLPILRTPPHNKILWAVRALLGISFNGPAAVIVFFVISGFCIHFPNRKGLAVKSWRMYFARRYLRILIPMSVAIALSVPLKMQFGLLSYSILWSLLCEEIYYLIYPMLLIARDRIGWRNLMAIAWVLAYLTVLTKPHAVGYPSYGSGLNWLLGLPCWLLGCKLAENFDKLDTTPVSRAQIWAWRGSAYALSALLRALQFHSPLHPPWTLDLYAVFGYFWIAQEIRYYRSQNRKPAFENLGEASYSIYLTHTHGPALLAMLPVAATLSPNAAWYSMVTVSAVFATAFYLLVERPSHRFARRYAKRAAWLQG